MSTKPWPRFIFEAWCNGSADWRIADMNLMRWPAWRCWLLKTWGRLQMRALDPFWIWVGK